MALRLTIRPIEGGDRQTRTLSRGTLSIGRAGGNDWVLADPDQHLSRTHCMVGFENGQYYITDLSTNGMHVNGAREATTRDLRIVLTDGDTIRFGGYLMEVAEIEESAIEPNRFGANNFLSSRADPFAATGADGGNPLDADPLGDPLSEPPGRGFHHPVPHPPPSIRRDDPFDVAEKRGSGGDDLFGGPSSGDSWKDNTPRESSGAVTDSYSPPRALGSVRPEEIDFDDLLGDIMPGSPPLTPAPAPAPSAPIRPTAHAAPPASSKPPSMDDFDDLLGDFPMPGGTPVAPMPPAPTPAPAAYVAPVAPLEPTPVLRAAPPVSNPPIIPFDPFAEEPVVRAAPQPMQAPVLTSMPAPVAQAQPAVAPVAPVPSAAPADPSSAALLAAFLEGAGLNQLDLAGDPEATMRAIGGLFRAFVGGTRDVLMSRAEIKHEMRVEQTMIRSKDNNALKFSVSPEEAVIALLRPRAGYKPPLASVEEAFDDIRSHEMALMAGMQTGLIALLKRFDPDALESRLQRGMLDGILPGTRKARFWELFCTTYKDIAREAEDDFHAVFGRDFAKAYNAQINKL